MKVTVNLQHFAYNRRPGVS